MGVLGCRKDGVLEATGPYWQHRCTKRLRYIGAYDAIKRDQMKNFFSNFARGVHTSYTIIYQDSSLMTKFELAGGDPAYVAPVI